ncbi:alpha/beta hydrolase family protein [Collimonas arenae]|uniref:Alpha/beta hydrolase family protein n=1 Tax=Collimonas arenae TaxID=279058 RepID=A0A127PLL2_9BURK|nr:YqiA/YcfP family alpha/beta fold hydrolase [Collimonas arenae]AMO98668.1 alpha/beta hydrolase family protein [Collimonas arenae]AMP08553.1 alpha/beta hydrolase family protein [Collimonas arenae]
MILYLHGFRSSPQSFKARLLAERMQQLGRADNYLCPQLPASPAAAIGLAQDCIKDCKPADLTLIGSSLGGYYATWLAEQIGCRAVLLNPAVKPPRDLEKYVGVSTQYHSDEPFEFKREYIAELQALQIDHITRPERYFLIAATGDEVLDWREMVGHYPQARQVVIEGSDHGISEFADYADAVLAFCGIPLTAGAAGSGL